MRIAPRILVVLIVAAGAMTFASGASAITSEQIEKLTLRDDLQRNDPASGFSSGGMGAGKWSTPSYPEHRGAAYNSGGRLGYGSPAGFSAAYWNAEKFKDAGNGVAVKATLTGTLGNGENVALWLNQPTPEGAITGYELVIIGGPNALAATARFYRWKESGLKLLEESIAVGVSGTTYALVEKLGTGGKAEVSAWAASGATGFVSPAGYQYTDSEPITEGYAGIQAFGTGPSLDNFSAGPLPPVKPTVSSSSPASPNGSTTPKIIGTAEAETTVRLYTNSTCTSAVAAKGSAAEFNSSGLEVGVAKGSTTTFYAQATNSDGLASACSTSSLKYVQLDPPTLSSSNPISPANNNSPRIVGSSPAGTTVKLYTNNTCTSTVAASGTAAAFASTGLTVTVSDNTTTTFYATATDAASNVSKCSTSSLKYEENSTGVLLETGFEEGLNGWNTSGLGESTPTVIGTDARTGTHSADFKLEGSQERSELILGGNGSGSGEGTKTFKEGQGFFYAFSFKIIKEKMLYGHPGAHNAFMQFKSDEVPATPKEQEEGKNSPRFALQLWNVEKEGKEFKGLWTGGDAQHIGGSGERFLAPVSEGEWHDIVMHIVASEEGKGLYQLYLDGSKIDEQENVTTMVPESKAAYIKNGLYRNGKELTGTSEILIDSARLGETLASVGGLGHP